MVLALSLNPFSTPQTLTLTTHHHHHHHHHHHRRRRRRRRNLLLRATLPNPNPNPKLSRELQSETLETLEWPRVCKHLSAFTATSMARSDSLSGFIPVGRTVEESRALLAQTGAAMSLPEPLDFSGVVDVAGIVEAACDGKLLTIGELCAVKRTLRAARKVREQLEEVGSKDGDVSQRIYPLLELLQNCNFLVELEQKIDFCLDCSLSVVLDRASDDLKLIRSERKENMDTLNALLRNISQMVFQAGGIDSPLITNRRSRMCVGIKATHRSLLPGGVVLNVSSSGATYFMEPKEAVELNNMEVRLANAEKDEERAILSLLTSELGKSAEDINELLGRIKEVDLAVARAGYAKWLNGVCPTLKTVGGSDTLLVDIEGVQHPLLLGPCLSSSKDVQSPNSENSQEIEERAVNSLREVGDKGSDFPIPIDIKIRWGMSVVIISGPNAGGKTASMKTLGLVSLMSKAGLYFPAKSIPVLPWFDLVLADIGDHQSLEQSLSTFSGHILRIGKILEVATKNSLVLIDEIGSGTDPSEGAALSASILQYLKDRVNLAVVTTHYADLSRLKEIDGQFENAAMEFSLETLRPTYQVLWGRAGDSNALKIARRIGFDDKIIDRAERWVEKLRPEKQAQRKGMLYRSLSEERDKMENRARGAASLRSDVMDLYHEIEGEAHDLDWREKALIAKESQQVAKELESAKSQLNTVVQDFEEHLRSTSVDKYGSLIKKAESSIASIVKSHSPITDVFADAMDDLYTPTPGEQVQVKRFGGKLATVVEVSEDDGSVLVQYGKVRCRVDRRGIQPIEESNGASSFSHLKKQARAPGNLDIVSERNNGEPSYGPMIQTSKNTVDLRGMRVEEASHALDIAIAAREPRSLLFIIHGMGTGVLKEHVIQVLKNHPRVVRFEQESPMNYGCTVAFIK